MAAERHTFESDSTLSPGSQSRSSTKANLVRHQTPLGIMHFLSKTIACDRLKIIPNGLRASG